MKDLISKIFIALIVLCLIFGTFYLGIYLKKKVSYGLIYESLVKKTVVKMVKPECLNSHRREYVKKI
jgi:hypothetical protein